MKNLLFVFISLIITSCNQKKSSKTEATVNKTVESNLNNENFDWLVGNWIRLNNDSDKKTFENWKKETDQQLLGHGFVMQSLDTIWQEKMILRKTDSIWVLEVKTPGNNDMVQFKMTNHTQNSFMVENPQHDFPKKIKYWKNKERLSALVSGDENELTFEFAPIK